MKIRLAAPTTKDSIVDGPGLRMVIWTQGCPHHCKGCHNPKTHDFTGGFEADTQDIMDQMDQLKLHQGITISGGEPLEQAAALCIIAQYAKGIGLDVWAYTGYVFEEILKKSEAERPEWRELLENTDVLVDGPFIEERKNLLLKFRGSENQRIICASESMHKGELVLMEG